MLINGIKVIVYLCRIRKGSRKQGIWGLRWTEAKNCIDEVLNQKAITLCFRWVHKCFRHGYWENCLLKLETNSKGQNQYLHCPQTGNHWRFRQDHRNERRPNYWIRHIPRVNGARITLLQTRQGAMIYFRIDIFNLIFFENKSLKFSTRISYY